MKKIINLELALVSIIALTACGGGNSDSVDGNATSTTTTTSTDTSNTPTSGGDQIVIDNSDGVAIGDDNSVQITCSEGGCGDITIYRKTVSE